MSKKQAILQAATTLFAIKGFKEASMAEVAEMVGAAGGTIFYHFKNKEELFLSILKDVKESIIEEFQHYFEKNKSNNGLEMIEKAVSFYLHLTSRMEDQFGILHRHYTYDLARVNPVCRGHLDAIYGCFFDFFEQAIIRGQKDGSVADVHPRRTAMLLFIMVDGLFRFNTFNLYEPVALYSELIESCRRMLSRKNYENRG